MHISQSLYPILAALLADILAQGLKVPCQYIRTKKLDFLWAFASGGFPSSHSATVSALTFAIGWQEGYDTPLFAITLVFSLIVIYDACHVRYYAGKGIALTQQLIKDINERGAINLDNPIYFEKLKTVLGHKTREVLGGCVVGLIVGYVFAIFSNIPLNL